MSVTCGKTVRRFLVPLQITELDEQIYYRTVDRKRNGLIRPLRAYLLEIIRTNGIHTVIDGGIYQALMKTGIKSYSFLATKRNYFVSSIPSGAGPTVSPLLSIVDWSHL